MIRHDPFLELAAIAIDFELSAAERARLEAHLAGCPACRRGAGTMMADARSLAAVPVAPLDPHRADGIIEQVLRPQPATRPTLRLLALAALLAVLAVGSVVVGAEILRQRDQRDQHDLSVVPEPPVRVELGSDLIWERAPDQAIFSDAGMTDVAVGPDGYVAVGCTTAGEFIDTGCTGAAWYSADGLRWERGTVPSADHLYLAGVITSPVGYVAWGYDSGASPGAALWVSPDGRQWQRAPTIPSFSFNHVFEVAWFQDRFVAHSDWNESRIWSSDDGLTWQDERGCNLYGHSSADPAPFGDSVHLIVVGDELLRIGTAFLPADDKVDRGAQDYRRVVTRTLDGVCSPSSSASDGWIFDIAATAGGALVGVGRQHDLVGAGAGSPLPPMAAWTSTDGLAWAPSRFSGEPPNGQLELVASGDPGILAIGTLDPNGLTVWRSDQGSVWRQAAAPAETGMLQGLAAIPGGFITVGREASASGGVTAVVWIAGPGPTSPSPTAGSSPG